MYVLIFMTLEINDIHSIRYHEYKPVLKTELLYIIIHYLKTKNEVKKEIFNYALAPIDEVSGK